jgi:hypothetical protein
MVLGVSGVERVLQLTLWASGRSLGGDSIAVHAIGPIWVTNLVPDMSIKSAPSFSQWVAPELPIKSKPNLCQSNHDN